MVEDLFFDQFGKRYLYYAYFSARNIGLALVLVSTAMWAIFGWDSTVEYTLLGEKNAYGYGTHWSTVQTIFLVFYLLALNLQVGGVRSFRQLGAEVKRDFRTFALQGFVILDLLRGKIGKAKEGWSGIRKSYTNYASVDPVRGFFFAGGFAFIATVLFELIWVPLYDYFNFGNWAWPVYYFGHLLFGSPLLGPIFARNVFELSILGVFGAIMFYTAVDGEKGNFRRRFSVKWRFDRYALALVVLTASLWILWVLFPHSKVDTSQLFVNPASIQSFHGVTQAELQNTQWLMPSQSYFPQTEYTFYNATAYLKTYASNEIYGFYAPNFWIHLVNVVTKYATFAAVCYPAMVKVKRN
jgi:hypothetical protein